jgi:radical SAM protein with 4Fe4S-binding SPASM domain
MRLNIDLRQVVRRGVTSLLAENAKGYPEAVHFLTLPVGRSGEVIYKTYSACLFPRMLILDSLLDCADFDKRITKELVEKEIIDVLRAKHPGVAGGWSYIPSFPELPPDTDDLGMAVQLLVRTGGKELASVCDEALHILFNFCSHPDGGFETWVVDPSDKSPLAAAMQEYIVIIGGRGASPEVLATLLYGLVLYDPERYRFQIAEGIQYLIASQKNEGFWPSKWYWGKFYGTYRALSLLSAINSGPDAIERARRFLCNSQMPDGGWGNKASDPLSTALGLLSLSTITGCLEEKQKGAAWLASAQATGGTWDSSPFIRLVTTDGELTYASRTVTTAFSIQALAKILQANSDLDFIPGDFPELPYRRETGRLCVLSDHRGRWTLVQGNDLRQQNRIPMSGQVGFSGEFADRRPALHIIELTRRCNQVCSYCAVSARRGTPVLTSKDVNHEKLDRIIDFILMSADSSFCVEFQGGEPLLNFPAMQYVVEAFARRTPGSGKRPEFRLVSNLTLLTPAIADYIAAWRIAVSTSLDGTQEVHEIHRKLCDGGHTYAKVVEGIRELRKRHVHVGAMMVVTPNALVMPEKIVDNFSTLALYRFGLNPVVPMGEAERHWNTIGLDPTAYSYFWKRIVQRCLAHQDQGIPIWDRASELMVRKIMLAQDPGYVDLASPCGCVHGQIAYDLQGNVYPCDEARSSGKIVLGNVLRHTFDNIIRHPDALSLIQASLITDERCGTCAYRPWCGRCPVANRLRFGHEDVYSEVTYHCRIWKSLFDRFFELLDEDPEGMTRFAFMVEEYG